MTWRIALNEPDLQKRPFFIVGLPLPASCDYRRYGQQRVRTNGSTSTHGFGNVEMLWDTLDVSQMGVLNRLVEDARAASGVLFMTIEAGDGLALGSEFVDISGQTNAIEQRQGGPLSLRIDGAHYDNISIILRDVSELSRPSQFK